MAALGHQAKGCRQMTLIEAGVDPTPELIEVETAETREYWRRRLVAKRVRVPDFVVVLDDLEREVAFRDRCRKVVGL